MHGPNNALRILTTTLIFAYAATLSGANAGPIPTPFLPLDSTLGDTVQLPGGRLATVSATGITKIVSKDGRRAMIARIPIAQKSSPADIAGGLPNKEELAREIDQATQIHKAYVDGRAIVVFRPGMGPRGSIAVSQPTLQAMRRATSSAQRSALAPAYTSDASTNRILADFGADRVDRLFQKALPRSTMRGRLDISNAYQIHLTNARVRSAVARLLKSPAVEYASPDWRVSAMHTQGFPIPSALVNAARSMSTAMRGRPARRTMSLATANSLPNNFMLTNSGQSLLNAPGLNAAVAFDEIGTIFHQLPGQGETITNVSLGDVAYSGNCNGETTTHFIGGQMYIDWPSMPLIAAYSADSSGNLSGSTEVCGVDPSLGEVGLDFSMMAPLPHDSQRAGEVGAGFTDLLGIAPGATYRLVVPQDTNPSTSSIAAAFIGAANQSPRPDVITASLGIGLDTMGFSGRYLEDDPLLEAVIASIVDNYNIAVCVSANDGTRTFTETAIGPSGGSVPTEKIDAGSTPTDLNDVGLSTVPSRDFDSGAIDVGGTTLDDIFAAPPQNPQFAALSSQHAYAETRWDGFGSFSSGFGSRVNVSAPSDNVVAMYCGNCFGQYNGVGLALAGGTSASAPEAAAAAAVALQVARLNGHPFSSPRALRTFLERTGTPVPGVPQADADLHVGSQINVGHIVETLLQQRHGGAAAPSVPRIAVEQRQNVGQLNAAFLTSTDPANIDLIGPCCDSNGQATDLNQRAWITIAPDWERLPPGAQFRLTVVGHDTSPLSATPWARLLPAQILAAAGLPLISSSSRTVNLRYRALQGTHVLAESVVPLTFGAANPTTEQVLAPVVPAVVTGATIPVKYNLAGSRGFPNPKLIVSRADRFNPLQWSLGAYFYTDYVAPLSGPTGTVQVPVSALGGGGIYGIAIVNDTAQPDPRSGPFPNYSDFAFVRVAPRLENSANRAQAPLLASSGSQPGHYLDITTGSPFEVSWNVSNIRGATGALLEISGPGPNFINTLNSFNNPNGSELDRNGHDSGSVYSVAVGTAGRLSLTTDRAHLNPTFNYTVRVIPTAGGVAIGEAGDVSTLQDDGVVPSNGGVMEAYGIDANNDNGYLASNVFQNGPSGTTTTGSLEAFSQATHQVTTTIATSNGFAATPSFSGGTVYANNVALYVPNIGNPTFDVVNLATNALSPWAVPSPAANNSLPLMQAASDEIHDGLFFAGDNGPNRAGIRDPMVFTSNVAANTFGPLYPVSAGLPTCTNSYGICDFYATAIAYNTQTNHAILGAGICACFVRPRFGVTVGPTEIITVDMSNGALNTFSLPNGTTMDSPPVDGLAVDSTTNTAVAPLANGTIAFINLATQTARIVDMPGAATYPAVCVHSVLPCPIVKGDFSGYNPTADSVHHLFLVWQPFSADWITNIASLGSLLTYDENGNLISKHETLFPYDAGFFIGSPDLPLRPQNRTGYLFSRYGTQLQPFSY